MISFDVKILFANRPLHKYVDDTHAYVEPKKSEFILNKINNYHPNGSFTFELVKNNEINFLGILIKRLIKVFKDLPKTPKS